MKNDNRKKCIKDTKGFSLVELLIAVAILSIIVVPVLTAFISATKANTKARRKLEATTAAQNVMENIKAVGVESFLSSLAVNGTAPQADNNGVYTIDNSAENAEGIPLIPKQILNNNTYRFKTVFDPGYYKTEEGSAKEGYNDITVADIKDMNVLEDAFYIEDESADQKIVDEYLNTTSIVTTYKDEKAIKQALTREIDIVINNVGTAENGVTNVKVNCIYTLDGDTDTEKTVSSVIYDNADVANGHLRSIYIFYTPLYAIQYGALSSSKDTIRILNNTAATDKNATSVNADVYLIKQHTTTAKESLEAAYKVDLSVNETVTKPVAWSPDDTYRAYTTILTNIGWNLNTPPNEIPAQYSGITYNYKNTTNSSNGKVTLPDKNKKYLGMTTLDNSSASNRLYQVTIQVFRQGETEALYTMNGTAEA